MRTEKRKRVYFQSETFSYIIDSIQLDSGIYNLTSQNIKSVEHNKPFSANPPFHVGKRKTYTVQSKLCLEIALLSSRMV